jgi:arsenate reductase (thioredoxin)
MPETTALKVLFFGEGNSCCSQMAEAVARAHRADQLEAYSAGVNVRGIDVLAVAALAEVGIDISGCRAKTISELGDTSFDCVVTIGDRARQHCPAFANGTTVIHWDIASPGGGPTVEATNPQGLEEYRRLRDRIVALVKAMPPSLQEHG